MFMMIEPLQALRWKCSLLFLCYAKSVCFPIQNLHQKSNIYEYTDLEIFNNVQRSSDVWHHG